MDVAIRWSTNTHQEPRFLIADAAGSWLRLCEPTSLNGRNIEYKGIARLEKLPEFTAFDWSRTDENLVALGTFTGEARVVRLDVPTVATSCVHSFPIKQTRECNSIAFGNNSLLATALKKHRTDSSLNVYDIGSAHTSAEPYRRLANGDAVANVKFFTDRPDTLLAGIYTKGLRLYDLRDSNPVGASFMSTRQCHFLSIDPLDENYFAAAGPPGENVVCLWDRRTIGHSSMANLSTASLSSAVLEINDVIDSQRQTTIRTMRFSGTKRGSFAILSSAGQLKQFDVAQNRSVSSYDAHQRDHTEDDIGDSFHYLKKSNDLQYPWFNKHLGREESTSTVAFDWASLGSLSNRHGIAHMRRNGKIEFLHIPSNPTIVKLTATNDIAFHVQSMSVVHSVPHKRSVAEDLLHIQARAQKQRRSKSSEKNRKEAMNGTHTDKHKTTNALAGGSKESSDLSNRQKHEQLLNFGLPTARLTLVDALTMIDVQRRRCEEGYLFDCDINKLIVKNDAWLVDMWDFIKRMQDMMKDGGMICENLDFSFLGVNSIWTGNLGQTSSRVSDRRSVSISDFETAIRDILSRRLTIQYSGVATDFPDRRQLGLIMCGWKFDEKKLRMECSEVYHKGEHYKAIVVAFWHNQKTVAIDMLKSATRANLIDNSGLAAVIACETVSKEQRSLCEWMAEDAKDPYLKSLLTYFTTGEWRAVAEMNQLPLMWRVAIALQYLDDQELDRFLKSMIKDAIRTGDIEGIILTGLSEESIDLFQNYIDKSSDLQTAVLVTAFANPRYLENDRWSFWKDAYFENMQSWRTFAERTRFTLQHSRMSVDRDGHKLIRPPPRQVTLRCNHCQKSISKIDDPPKQNDNGPKPNAQASRPQTTGHAAGTACPKCGRRMPRCCLCMLWLGTPDTSTVVGATALKVDETMAKFINFCISCGHGYHANHAREWFAKHQICPVPSCKCMCALRRA